MAVVVTGSRGCCSGCSIASLVSASLLAGGTTSRISIRFNRSRLLKSVTLNGVEVSPSLNAIGTASPTFTIDIGQLVLVGSVTVNVIVRDPKSSKARCVQTFPFVVTGSGVVPEPPS